MQHNGKGRVGMYIRIIDQELLYVYHFTNLVVAINIKLRTLGHKNRSHVRYLLPHIEHERLMDTIGTRDDPDGLLV